MTDRWGELRDLQGPEEEQATLALWALAEALARSRGERADCLPLETLAAFSAGSLGGEGSDAVLAHLASCPRCRAQEDLLREQMKPPPAFVIHLPTLRRAAARSGGRVTAVLSDLRAWLERVLRRGIAERGPGRESELLIPAHAWTSAGPSGPAGFRLESPAALDRRGRLSIELAAEAAPEQPFVIVAIQDAEHRLELCAAPVKEGKARAIVDCAFLELAEGAIPPSLIRLALVPAEQAQRWGAPRILEALRTLVESSLDPIEFFDGVSVALSTQGEAWQQRLRAEIAALPAPPEGTAVVQAALEQISRYATLWQESNQAECPGAAEIISRLTEIAQATQRPGRGDATVGPARPAKSRRRSQESLDV